MKLMNRIKTTLCGYNPLGDFAELVNHGTDTTIEITAEDRVRGSIRTKCWCCTFWRGIIVGVAIGIGLYSFFTLFNL